MSPSPKELGDELSPLQTMENLSAGEDGSDSVLRKRMVETGDRNNNSLESTHPKRVEVLYDGYYYDVTDFIKRHPGGNIIELYTENGEDATIPIQQFHYRSLKTVLARMKGLKKRPATDEEGKKVTVRSNCMTV